jgi:glutathione synthase/RimK-type ligase-like ATP-grasp enzyme
MLIAIHSSKISYSEKWIKYCEERHIPFKLVDCYRSDIIYQLEECDALMWHYFHGDPRDMLFADKLLSSVESSGKVVYPNFKSTWHFDDKVAQKYLLEANHFPIVPSFVFYSKKEAVSWIQDAEFPMVMKLRNGSGGNNVRLVKTKGDAHFLINKAFGRGFRATDPMTDFKDKLRKYRKSQAKLKDVLKALVHLIYPYRLEKSRGREKGYIYFQKFIPDCTYDIRIQVVNGNVWAMIRKVREGDFRASGSDDVIYDKEIVSEGILDLSYNLYDKLGMQTIAIDILISSGEPFITEVCYAFGVDEEDYGEGYWDRNREWHPGRFNPFGWMVDSIIDSLESREKSR